MAHVDDVDHVDHVDDVDEHFNYVSLIRAVQMLSSTFKFREAFSIFDRDKDGFIDVGEFKTVIFLPAQGRMALQKRMNFRKNSKWPLPPPLIFEKSYCEFATKLR